MAITSLQAAKKICELSNWTITNLHIHKILYIANMVYLGRHKEPLINEKFEAWQYGPVLLSLYNKLKIFGSIPIPIYAFSNVDKLSDAKEIKDIQEAWEKLKDKKVWELIAITHRKNGAWEKHYKENLNKIIPTQSILDEYENVTRER